MHENELKHYELKNLIDPEALGFQDTSEIKPQEGIIGQERVVKTFEFGLKAKSKGYNIYMAGAVGYGKTTYAMQKAKEVAALEKTPDDWCYVYNFKNQQSPIALRFAPGHGKEFREDMEELIELLVLEIPKAFNSDDYDKQKSAIVKNYQEKRDVLMHQMSAEAKEYGFGVKMTNSGVYFMPVIDGETIHEEEYDELSEEQKEVINKQSEIIQDKAAEIMRSVREFEKQTRKEIEELDYKVGLFALGYHFNTMQEKYKDYEQVIIYLKNVQEDILENIRDFLDEDSEEESLESLLPWMSKKSTDELMMKYKVNLLVDNGESKGAPVVVDFNPTYNNLIGEIEYDNEFGNLTTDFMKIKPGLLHKANGGYLVIQTYDLLNSVQSWEGLRRALKTEEITIDNLREQLGGLTLATLKPEPIPCDIKVIMVGSGYYYDLLYAYDEEFQRLFKICAEFDYEMNFNKHNVNRIGEFVKIFTEKKGTKDFTADAVAKVIEYASRLAERNDKLSTCFGQIEEALYEASIWADQEQAKWITGRHIQKAIDEKMLRLNLYEEKLTEMIEQDYVMIETEGERIGQINGLAVLDTGKFTFGKPVKITATTYVGKAGIVNIEKEANMSGSIHDKGVLTLIGYLGEQYAQEFPLSFSGRLSFEQNYSEINGDSASSAELYALLSSLAGVPIKQEIAVTGSVNQKGQIQAIGGVTYKIEGFYDLCKKRGLTGQQGVIIPKQNVRDLVLKDEVVEAVKEGNFHIYAIGTVEEGITLLTGLEAGSKDSKNMDCIYKKVWTKLKEYYIKSNGEPVQKRRR